jgi:hypothetical protein
MATKSKFFRAFVAGQTISDGRVITPEMINEVVETFNAATYTPRINIEHIAGYSPEPPFNGYGDVIAVKAQDDDFVIAGKTEKRRALYAQVDGNDQLVALAAAEQKPFPSVELTPSYAGTNKVGLIGLAFTDQPASIGTEKLQVSRSAPGTIFSSAEEAVALEFDAKPVEATGIADAIKNGLAGLAAAFSRAEPEKPKEEPDPLKPANDNFDVAKFTAAFATAMGPVIVAAVKPANDGLAALRADFTALKGKLESTDDGKPRRSFSTGGEGNGSRPKTDC